MRPRGRRAALAGPACCLLSLLLLSCGQDVYPLKEVEVTGDPAVLARFQGTWYDYEQVLGARVRGTAPARVAMRPPPGYRIENARTEGGEIRFTVGWSGETTEVSLRFLDDDTIFFGTPSDPDAGCGSCNPCFERLNVWGLMVHRAGALTEEAAESFEDSVGWLAGVL